MKKIDSAVLKETAFVGTVVLILSVLMQAVFLIIGKWDYTVLLGNILGFVAAVGNFFLMGLSVQKALGKEEKEAKGVMKTSQSLRLLMLAAVCAVGYLAPVFHILAVVIPLLFPRIAFFVRPLIKKEK